MNYQKPDEECLKLFRKILGLPDVPKKMYIKSDIDNSVIYGDAENWINLDYSIDSKLGTFLHRHAGPESYRVEINLPTPLSFEETRVELRRYWFMLDGRKISYFLGKLEQKNTHKPMLCFWQ